MKMSPGMLFMACMVAILCTVASQTSKPPNIVFVLTDDQDLDLGGMDHMYKTKRLIGEQGIIFEHAFASVPICCPSRASILTGKFQHNHHTFNNSVDGGCSSTSWQRNQETKAFPVYLKQQGYTTFFAVGLPTCCCTGNENIRSLLQYGYAASGGTKHVPPGWDWWYGLVGNSVYYNYKLSVNGTEESHGDDYMNDYLTDLINRKGQQFLELQHESSAPFFMMLSTPACHEPFPPAPHYANYFSDIGAPRDHGNFNYKAHDKHWLVEQAIVPMPNDTLDLVDNYFRSRLRTLLSVDDMVQDLHDILDRKHLLNNTYLFFTSDHGYHLGQFGLPYDKREPYEFDIRVPLMIRGPGIDPGLVSKENPMNIDLGPTFISLAGGSVPSDMDGKSLEPLWTEMQDSSGFRNDILIEYSGEEQKTINGCPQWTDQRLANCNPKAHCVCEDSHNNTWACLRSNRGSRIYKYCEFEDDMNFKELYELKSDKWEYTNLIRSTDQALVTRLQRDLHRMVACSGASCHTQV